MLDLPLVQFEAANCGLSGALADLGQSSPVTASLKVLNLHGNQLQGPIPASWSGLQALGCLQLTNNPALCGDIPDNLPCFDTLGTSLGEFAEYRRGSTSCPVCSFAHVAMHRQCAACFALDKQHLCLDDPYRLPLVRIGHR